MVAPSRSPGRGAPILASGVTSGDVFASGVIYPDGSCLTLPREGYGPPLVLGAGDTAFTSDPTLLTSVESLQLPSGYSPEGLVEVSVDGLPRKVLLSGAVSDPVWSSRGDLALVRAGWVWVGQPGKLRRLARGSAPSWSPSGRRIVFQRSGWLMIGAVRGRSFRRLAQGTAPAWSPDGRWIAFFGKRHRLSIVRVRGGRVRRVGQATGTAVDWQPLLSKQPITCLTPPGSNVLASSDTAILSVDNVGPSNAYPVATSAALGCLRADGRERQLKLNDVGPASAIRGGQVSGSYAAVVFHIFYAPTRGDQLQASVVNLLT
jgi:hypothetical protein